MSVEIDRLTHALRELAYTIRNVQNVVAETLEHLETHTITVEDLEETDEDVPTLTSSSSTSEPQSPEQ
jgi:hypothetical protein